MIPTLFSYLPHWAANAICKLAEGEQPAKKPSHILNEALGMGIGTLAGRGAADLANQAYKHFAKKPEGIPIPHLMYAVPVLGAGLGLAYNMAKAHQLEETQRAVEGSSPQAAAR
jgi:hypothetical protein